MQKVEFVTKDDTQRLCVGWKEWAALPELGIEALEVKVDTGARTSAIHSFDVEPFEKEGKPHVRFGLHPDRHSQDPEIFCEAPVVDQRVVSDSGGHKEMRYVIETPIHMGGQSWPIEITLTSRENMAFRMLLGRQAMRHRIVVQPEAKYLLKTPKTN